MQIKIINSGSTGNGYAVGDEDEVLLIEAGCRFKDVQKALRYNTMGIKGMCISHAHGDHFLYHDQYRNRGFPIMTPFLNDKTYAKMGRFSVQAFEVPHQQDLKCYGFLIKHPQIGKLLFMTDLEYCPYNMANVKPDFIMVECNYMGDYIDYDFLVEQKMRIDHKFSGHMSLETCKTFINSVKNENLKHIVLIHMSMETCNRDEAKRQIQEIAGENVTVDIAEKGKSIDIGDIK